MPSCGRKCATTGRRWQRSTSTRTRSQSLWVWRTCTDNEGRGTGTRRHRQCLDPAVPDESVQQQRVHQAYIGEYRKRRRALDQGELLQQCRDAVSNHPDVETHADAPERLGPQVANDPHPEGNSHDQARENVWKQADALGHEHPGEVVGRRGKRRFGKPHEPESGAEVLLGKPLVAQHESQRWTGDGGDGIQHAERPAERQADGALGFDGPANARGLQQNQRQQHDERSELEPARLYSVYQGRTPRDRKSTRLNSSHRTISYAV